MPCRGLRAFFGRVTAQFMASPGVHGAKEGSRGAPRRRERREEDPSSQHRGAFDLRFGSASWPRRGPRGARGSRKGRFRGSRASERTRCRDTEGTPSRSWTPVALFSETFWRVRRPFEGRKRLRSDCKRSLYHWCFLLTLRLRSEASHYRGSKALYGSIQGLQTTPSKPFSSSFSFN